MRLRFHLTFAVAVATLACMQRCVNDSDTLYGAGTDSLPDLSPSETAPARSSTGPSVQSLDRRNWTTVVIDSPRGQVEHQPTYGELLVLNGQSARDGDTFPTVESAMQLGSSIDHAAADGAVEFAWPAVLMVVAPARMCFGMPPWLTVQSPQQASGMMPPIQTRDNETLWVWVAVPTSGEARTP